MLDHGVIRTKKDDGTRLRLATLVREVYGILRDFGNPPHGRHGIVVEMHVGGQNIGGREIRTEKQAMASAAIFAACQCFETGVGTMPALESERLLTPMASTWTRNFAAKVGEQDGKNRDKAPRVRQARELLGLKKPLAESAKHAADVADALLMACWGAEKLGVGQTLYAGEVTRVIAFDPAIVTCGYAVIEWVEA